MSIARVAGQTDQIAFTSSGTSIGMTFPQNVVSGNGLLCLCKGDNTLTGTYPNDMTVADSGSSVYAKDKTDFILDEHRDSIFSTKLAGSGANTVTLTSAGDGAGPRTITGMEYTFAGGPVFDKSASAQATSASADSGATATTTAANELLFGGVSDTFNGTPYTATGSWTKRQESGSGAGRIAYFDQIVSATAAYNMTCTLAASNLWLAMIATYKEFGGGAPAQITPYFNDDVEL